METTGDAQRGGDDDALRLPELRPSDHRGADSGLSGGLYDLIFVASLWANPI